MIKSTRFLTFAIFCAAAILRLANLGSAQLWYDETFTYLVTSKDLTSMLAAIAGDVHPPLYYLVVWPIAHLAGLNETWLRLPCVLFGLLAIWLTGLIADQVGLTTRARLVGQALVAFLPVGIYYAQEARMYTLLQMLVLAWLLMVLRRRWRLAALFGTLTLYTHNYALFYAAAIGLVALAGEIRRPVIINPENKDYSHLNHWQPGDEANLSGAVRSLLIPGLLWLPWQFVLLIQMGNVAAGYWIQPVNLGNTINALFLSFWSFYPPENTAVLTMLLLFVLLSYSVIRSRRVLTGLSWIVLMLVGFGPLLLAVTCSLAWKPILLFRGLIASMPLLCLLIAAAVTSGPGWKLIYTSAMITPLLVGGLWHYYAGIAEDKGSIHANLAELRQLWQPGDLLLHSNSSSYLSWATYAPDLHQAILPMPPCDVNGGDISEQTREALEVYADDEEAERVWMLWDEGPTTTDCERQRNQQLIADAVPALVFKDNRYIRARVFLIER